MPRYQFDGFSAGNFLETTLRSQLSGWARSDFEQLLGGVEEFRKKHTDVYDRRNVSVSVKIGEKELSSIYFPDYLTQREKAHLFELNKLSKNIRQKLSSKNQRSQELQLNVLSRQLTETERQMRVLYDTSKVRRDARVPRVLFKPDGNLDSNSPEAIAKLATLLRLVLQSAAVYQTNLENRIETLIAEHASRYSDADQQPTSSLELTSEIARLQVLLDTHKREELERQQAVQSFYDKYSVYLSGQRGFYIAPGRSNPEAVAPEAVMGIPRYGEAFLNDVPDFLRDEIRRQGVIEPEQEPTVRESPVSQTQFIALTDKNLLKEYNKILKMRKLAEKIKANPRKYTVSRPWCWVSLWARWFSGLSDDNVASIVEECDTFLDNLSKIQVTILCEMQARCKRAFSKDSGFMVDASGAVFFDSDTVRSRIEQNRISREVYEGFTASGPNGEARRFYSRNRVLQHNWWLYDVVATENSAARGELITVITGKKARFSPLNEPIEIETRRGDLDSKTLNAYKAAVARFVNSYSGVLPSAEDTSKAANTSRFLHSQADQLSDSQRKLQQDSELFSIVKQAYGGAEPSAEQMKHKLLRKLLQESPSIRLLLDKLQLSARDVNVRDFINAQGIRALVSDNGNFVFYELLDAACREYQQWTPTLGPTLGFFFEHNGLKALGKLLGELFVRDSRAPTQNAGKARAAVDSLAQHVYRYVGDTAREDVERLWYSVCSGAQNEVDSDIIVDGYLNFLRLHNALPKQIDEKYFSFFSYVIRRISDPNNKLSSAEIGHLYNFIAKLKVRFSQSYFADSGLGSSNYAAFEAQCKVMCDVLDVCRLRVSDDHVNYLLQNLDTHFPENKTSTAQSQSGETVNIRLVRALAESYLQDYIFINHENGFHFHDKNLSQEVLDASVIRFITKHSRSKGAVEQALGSERVRKEATGKAVTFLKEYATRLAKVSAKAEFDPYPNWGQEYNDEDEGRVTPRKLENGNVFRAVNIIGLYAAITPASTEDQSRQRCLCEHVRRFILATDFATQQVLESSRRPTVDYYPPQRHHNMVWTQASRGDLVDYVVALFNYHLTCGHVYNDLSTTLGDAGNGTSLFDIHIGYHDAQGRGCDDALLIEKALSRLPLERSAKFSGNTLQDLVDKVLIDRCTSGDLLSPNGSGNQFSIVQLVFRYGSIKAVEQLHLAFISELSSRVELGKADKDALVHSYEKYFNVLELSQRFSEWDIASVKSSGYGKLSELLEASVLCNADGLELDETLGKFMGAFSTNEVLYDLLGSEVLKKDFHSTKNYVRDQISIRQGNPPKAFTTYMEAYASALQPGSNVQEVRTGHYFIESYGIRASRMIHILDALYLRKKTDIVPHRLQSYFSHVFGLVSDTTGDGVRLDRDHIVKSLFHEVSDFAALTTELESSSFDESNDIARRKRAFARCAASFDVKKALYESVHSILSKFDDPVFDGPVKASRVTISIEAHMANYRADIGEVADASVRKERLEMFDAQFLAAVRERIYALLINSGDDSFGSELRRYVGLVSVFIEKRTKDGRCLEGFDQSFPNESFDEGYIVGKELMALKETLSNDLRWRGYRGNYQIVKDAFASPVVDAAGTKYVADRVFGDASKTVLQFDDSAAAASGSDKTSCRTVTGGGPTSSIWTIPHSSHGFDKLLETGFPVQHGSTHRQPSIIYDHPVFGVLSEEFARCLNEMLTVGDSLTKQTVRDLLRGIHCLRKNIEKQLSSVLRDSHPYLQALTAFASVIECGVVENDPNAAQLNAFSKLYDKCSVLVSELSRGASLSRAVALQLAANKRAVPFYEALLSAVPARRRPVDDIIDKLTPVLVHLALDSEKPLEIFNLPEVDGADGYQLRQAGMLEPVKVFSNVFCNILQLLKDPLSGFSYSYISEILQTFDSSSAVLQNQVGTLSECMVLGLSNALKSCCEKMLAGLERETHVQEGFIQSLGRLLNMLESHYHSYGIDSDGEYRRAKDKLTNSARLFLLEAYSSRAEALLSSGSSEYSKLSQLHLATDWLAVFGMNEDRAWLMQRRALVDAQYVSMLARGQQIKGGTSEAARFIEYALNQQQQGVAVVLGQFRSHYGDESPEFRDPLRSVYLTHQVTSHQEFHQFLADLDDYFAGSHKELMPLVTWMAAQRIASISDLISAGVTYGGMHDVALKASDVRTVDEWVLVKTAQRELGALSQSGEDALFVLRQRETDATIVNISQITWLGKLEELVDRHCGEYDRFKESFSSKWQHCKQQEARAFQRLCASDLSVPHNYLYLLRCVYRFFETHRPELARFLVELLQCLPESEENDVNAFYKHIDQFISDKKSGIDERLYLDLQYTEDGSALTMLNDLRLMALMRMQIGFIERRVHRQPDDEAFSARPIMITDVPLYGVQITRGSFDDCPGLSSLLEELGEVKGDGSVNGTTGDTQRQLLLDKACSMYNLLQAVGEQQESMLDVSRQFGTFRRYYVKVLDHIRYNEFREAALLISFIVDEARAQFPNNEVCITLLFKAVIDARDLVERIRKAVFSDGLNGSAVASRLRGVDGAGLLGRVKDITRYMCPVTAIVAEEWSLEKLKLALEELINRAADAGENFNFEGFARDALAFLQEFCFVAGAEAKWFWYYGLTCELWTDLESIREQQSFEPNSPIAILSRLSRSVENQLNAVAVDSGDLGFLCSEVKGALKYFGRHVKEQFPVLHSILDHCDDFDIFKLIGNAKVTHEQLNEVLEFIQFVPIEMAANLRKKLMDDMTASGGLIRLVAALKNRSPYDRDSILPILRTALFNVSRIFPHEEHSENFLQQALEKVRVTFERYYYHGKDGEGKPAFYQWGLDAESVKECFLALESAVQILTPEKELCGGVFDDPLLRYKFEAANLYQSFVEMLQRIRTGIHKKLSLTNLNLDAGEFTFLVRHKGNFQLGSDGQVTCVEMSDSECTAGQKVLLFLNDVYAQNKTKFSLDEIIVLCCIYAETSLSIAKLDKYGDRPQKIEYFVHEGFQSVKNQLCSLCDTQTARTLFAKEVILDPRNYLSVTKLIPVAVASRNVVGLQRKVSMVAYLIARLAAGDYDVAQSELDVLMGQPCEVIGLSDSDATAILNALEKGLDSSHLTYQSLEGYEGLYEKISSFLKAHFFGETRATENSHFERVLNAVSFHREQNEKHNLILSKTLAIVRKLASADTDRRLRNVPKIGMLQPDIAGWISELRGAGAERGLVIQEPVEKLEALEGALNELAIFMSGARTLTEEVVASLLRRVKGCYTVVYEQQQSLTSRNNAVVRLCDWKQRVERQVLPATRTLLQSEVLYGSANLFVQRCDGGLTDYPAGLKACYEFLKQLPNLDVLRFARTGSAVRLRKHLIEFVSRKENFLNIILRSKGISPKQIAMMWGLLGEYKKDQMSVKFHLLEKLSALESQLVNFWNSEELPKEDEIDAIIMAIGVVRESDGDKFWLTEHATLLSQKLKLLLKLRVYLKDSLTAFGKYFAGRANQKPDSHYLYMLKLIDSSNPYNSYMAALRDGSSSLSEERRNNIIRRLDLLRGCLCSDQLTLLLHPEKKEAKTPLSLDYMISVLEVMSLIGNRVKGMPNLPQAVESARLTSVIQKGFEDAAGKFSSPPSGSREAIESPAAAVVRACTGRLQDLQLELAQLESGKAQKEQVFTYCKEEQSRLERYGLAVDYANPAVLVERMLTVRREIIELGRLLQATVDASSCMVLPEATVDLYRADPSEAHDALKDYLSKVLVLPKEKDSLPLRPEEVDCYRFAKALVESVPGLFEGCELESVGKIKSLQEQMILLREILSPAGIRSDITISQLQQYLGKLHETIRAHISRFDEYYSQRLDVSREYRFLKNMQPFERGLLVLSQQLEFVTDHDGEAVKIVAAIGSALFKQITYLQILFGEYAQEKLSSFEVSLLSAIRSGGVTDETAGLVKAYFETRTMRGRVKLATLEARATQLDFSLCDAPDVVKAQLERAQRELERALYRADIDSGPAPTGQEKRGWRGELKEMARMAMATAAANAEVLPDVVAPPAPADDDHSVAARLFSANREEIFVSVPVQQLVITGEQVVDGASSTGSPDASMLDRTSPVVSEAASVLSLSSGGGVVRTAVLFPPRSRSVTPPSPLSLFSGGRRLGPVSVPGAGAAPAAGRPLLGHDREVDADTTSVLTVGSGSGH